MNEMMVKLRNWDLIELPGRALAMPIQQLANLADVKVANLRKALQRYQPRCEYPLVHVMTGVELRKLKSKGTKCPFVEPEARHLAAVTLPGIAMLGVAFKNLRLTVEAILVAMEYSGRNRAGTLGSGSKSSVGLLEHKPAQSKPRKRAGPKVTCDLDADLHDWLLEFAASKGMTKAEATRQIIRDRRELEESTTV